MKETMLYGHEEIKKEIKAICINSKAYSIGRVRPNNFIIQLDKGNGRTTLARYITEMFYKYNIIKFSSLDLFLEIDLDGTMNQLKESFGDIYSTSCYANSYEGIILLCIDSLSNHINEAQVDYFLKEIVKVSKTATLIFYIPENPSQNVNQLVKKIYSVLKDTILVNENIYTEVDLALITEKLINQRGVKIINEEKFHKQLVNLIIRMEFKKISEIDKLSKELITITDYSTLTPKIDDSLLKEVNI